jgi:DNA mismatch endonuclease (patch repair protein)
MVDIVSPQTRSRMMASIRGADTAPELLVRAYLHRAGLRFHVHVRQLPGTPDIVFPNRKLAVFVHGCFWHRHVGCPYCTTPATRPDFWARKFEANRARDRRNVEQLHQIGWAVLTVWECQTASIDELDRLFWQIVAAQP